MSSEALLVIMTPDLAGAVGRWREGLSSIRRMSPKTEEAYGRDVEQFARFLTGHFGSPASLAMLADLKPADIRAFLADRRREGVGAATLGRQLAGLRSLIRFLEREGHGSSAAVSVVRTPKTGRRLPKALGVADALAVTDTDRQLALEPWIAARDAAVLSLLYGAGLRISEALSVTVADLPSGPDGVLRVTGKGARRGWCRSSRRCRRPSPPT